jgi:hypothetical protein
MTAVTVLRRACLLVAAVLVLAGCKVDAQIHITLDEDGTGTVTTTVTLDADAVRRVEANGRTLDAAFPLADLGAAGWEITPWVRDPDGSASIELTHTYTGEEELALRLTELTGPTNLLGDVVVRQDRTFLRTHDEVSVAADLRDPALAIMRDEELVASLQAAGLDVAALEAQLQGELRDALSVELTVEGPGGRVQTVEVDAGERETATAARSQFDGARLMWLVMAGMLSFLAVLLYLAASIGARRGRVRRARMEAERTPLM